MSGFPSTADLYDRHGERLRCCDIQFRQFGGHTRFAGRIVTVSSREDNAILKQVLACPGAGRVVIVDSGGGLHCAMLGDNMAATAADNGWAGLIIHGAVRDVAALVGLPIGIKALGTNPRRSLKHGAGEIDVPVAFGGVVFRPGDLVASDEDGVVVLPDH